jgi:hypothetical protein
MVTIHEKNRVELLKNLTDADAAVGHLGRITRTGNMWYCKSASGSGSTWEPGDGVWRVRDYAILGFNADRIQDVLNDLTSTGGIVEIDTGTWTLTSKLTIPYHNIVLRGAGGGHGCHIQCDTTLTGAYIQIGEDGYKSSPTRQSVTIENITISHKTAGATGSIGIDVRNATKVLLRRVEIDSIERAVRFQGENHYNKIDGLMTSGCEIDVHFHNGSRSCWVVNSRLKGDVGVKIEQGSDAGCSNIVVRDCGIESFTDAGVDILATSTNGIYFVKVADCRIETGANDVVGIRVVKAGHVKCRDNYFVLGGTGTANVTTDQSSGASATLVTSSSGTDHAWTDRIA